MVNPASATSGTGTPTGRAARGARLVAAAVVFAAWLGLSSIGGPVFGTISAVTNNDQTSYLPATAE